MPSVSPGARFFAASAGAGAVPLRGFDARRARRGASAAAGSATAWGAVSGAAAGATSGAVSGADSCAGAGTAAAAFADVFFAAAFVDVFAGALVAADPLAGEVLRVRPVFATAARRAVFGAVFAGASSVPSAAAGSGTSVGAGAWTAIVSVAGVFCAGTVGACCAAGAGAGASDCRLLRALRTAPRRSVTSANCLSNVPCCSSRRGSSDCSRAMVDATLL